MINVEDIIVQKYDPINSFFVFLVVATRIVYWNFSHDDKVDRLIDP